MGGNLPDSGPTAEGHFSVGANIDDLSDIVLRAPAEFN